jgi:hypothetical protein
MDDPIRFYGLYGPRTRYLDFGSFDARNKIWFWVHGARARARTREGGHK